VAQPYFSGGGELLRTSSGTIERGSLDMNVLVAVLRDRAKRVAIRRTADAISKAVQSELGGFPLHDVLVHAAPLFSESGSLERKEVELLVKSLVRAVFATSIVNAKWPTDDKLGALEAWGKGEKTTADLLWARGYVVSATYWALAAEKLLSDPGAKLPVCAAGTSETRRAFCDAIAKHKGGLPNWVKKATDMDKALASLAALSQIALPKSRDREIDIAAFLDAILRTGSIASFETSAGLELDKWAAAYAPLAKKVLLLPVWSSDSSKNPIVSSLENLNKLLAAATPDRTAIQEAAKAVSRALAGASGESAKVLLDKAQWDAFERWIKNLEQWSTDTLPADPASFALSLYLTSKGFSTGIITDVNRDIAKLAAVEQEIRTLLGATKSASNSVDGVPFANLLRLTTAITDAETAFGTLVKGAEKLQVGEGLESLRAAYAACGSLRQVLELLIKIDVPLLRDKTAGEVVAILRTLGPRAALLLDAARPAFDLLRRGAELDAAALVTIVQRIDAGELLAALGVPVEACKADGNGAACWGIRIVHVLRDSIENDTGTIKLDGAKLAEGLSVAGDDFKRREKGGVFFHLTVGMGAIYVTNPPKLIETNTNGVITKSLSTGSDHFAPLAAEQIGIGYASPTYGNWVTLKVGAFGSGLLYRAVVDTEESDAFMFGGVIAADVDELLELYVAPTWMVYPPIQGMSYPSQFGLAIGAQVPLGDYLLKLSK
jgi:hypothetical protein